MVAGADPGFPCGRGGQKIMCAHTHHKSETRIPLYGLGMLKRALEVLGLLCFLLLSEPYQSILMQNGIRKHSLSKFRREEAPVAPPLNPPLLVAHLQVANKDPLAWDKTREKNTKLS